MFVGIGVGVGRQRVSGGGGFDADYQAVLNYATSLGYTLPSAAQQVKQNQLMLDLKAGGIWTKLDTLRVYATDGSSSFALIDWKRLALCTAVNSPTFTTNQGFQGNGTSSYINVNLNTSNQLVKASLNNICIGFYEYSTTTGNNGVISSAQGSSTDIILTQKFGGGNGFVRINEQSSSAPSVSLYKVGLVLGNRTSSTQKDYYNPDKTKISYTITANSLPNGMLYDLRFSTLYSLTPQSIGFLGASLTSNEIDNLYICINAYMTSL